MTTEEVELRKMSTNELIAYHNILVAGSRMIIFEGEPGRQYRHLRIVKQILGAPHNLNRLTAVEPETEQLSQSINALWNTEGRVDGE